MPRPDPTPTPGRKADHLRIAAGPGIQHGAGAGLDAVRMRHRALPERDLADVALDCELLGARLRAPLLISAMTGGAAAATDINRRLADAAAEHGVGARVRLGPAAARGPVAAAHLPRARAAPGRRCCSPTSAPRRCAGRARPTARSGSSSCSAPTGCPIHLNAVQEAVQPEGEPEFAGVLDGIAAVAERLAPRPVVVKEVGFGMDAEDVRGLAATGVAAIDVAGAGGTNWALIEGRRDPRAGAVAAAFGDWGVPTVDALARRAPGRAAGHRLGRPAPRRRRREVPRARRDGRRAGAAVPDRGARGPRGRGAGRGAAAAADRDLGGGRAVGRRARGGAPAVRVVVDRRGARRPRPPPCGCRAWAPRSRWSSSARSRAAARTGCATPATRGTRGRRC